MEIDSSKGIVILDRVEAEANTGHTWTDKAKSLYKPEWMTIANYNFMWELLEAKKAETKKILISELNLYPNVYKNERAFLFTHYK